MKVIIIEDRPEIALIIRSYVQLYADEVILAETKEEALLQLDIPPPPDIVTLDLGLPDSRVEATVEWIAELRKKVGDAILLIITGMSVDEDRAMALGADGIIHKPHEASRQGFFSVLGGVIQSIIGQPPPYKRSVEIAERVAAKLAPILQAVTVGKQPEP